jgi:hypothetical protein
MIHYSEFLFLLRDVDTWQNFASIQRLKTLINLEKNVFWSFHSEIIGGKKNIQSCVVCLPLCILFVIKTFFSDFLYNRSWYAWSTILMLDLTIFFVNFDNFFREFWQFLVFDQFWYCGRSSDILKIIEGW